MLTNKENYFELLGIRQEFDIDKDELESNYYLAQKKYHPDNFGSNNLSDDDQHLIIKSMLINDAYDTLNDDVARASYLLSLSGISIKSHEENAIKAPPDLVMEIMEIREELENNSDNQDNIKETLDELKARKIQLYNNINKYYLEKNLEKMALETIRLQYIEKILVDYK